MKWTDSEHQDRYSAFISTDLPPLKDRVRQAQFDDYETEEQRKQWKRADFYMEIMSACFFWGMIMVLALFVVLTA
jgi:hypothetical protein